MRAINWNALVACIHHVAQLVAREAPVAEQWHCERPRRVLLTGEALCGVVDVVETRVHFRLTVVSRREGPVALASDHIVQRHQAACQRSGSAREQSG